MLRNFQQCHTQRPNIGRDSVGLSSNAFWGHVVGGADERIGVTLGAELAADTEIAELDLSITTQKNV